MADQSLDLGVQLEADLKSAMIARDEVKTSILRLLKAALQNQKIELGHDLSAQEMTQVLQREAKKRHDAAIAYEQAGRADLAAQEESEHKAIAQYLPAQLSDQELHDIVAEQIAKTKVTELAQMGQVVAAVMPLVAGRADGGRVSQMVRDQLT